jgi:hypothetical protein
VPTPLVATGTFVALAPGNPSRSWPQPGVECDVVVDHVREPRIPVKPRTATVSLLPVQAQAYCGPAHGYRWAIDPDTAPPLFADAPSAGLGTASYRLILNPRTRQPARDHQGRLLYWYAPPAERPARPPLRPGDKRPGTKSTGAGRDPVLPVGESRRQHPPDQ